ncbi:MAG: hypothetical protein CMG35_04195 [Candidatus Marinimicrobia bacterium]|nr:hypothetical protein [Candidatus Neomarinimicrobiota bacterium]|tara:strand:- start:1835 stop:2422 length:588 start_codon:yes stop_codon:yes gene_type:complete
MLVIGNGESRKDINISNINMKKVGCNAIHRDHYVDHLICVDRRMVQEAVDNRYHQNSKIYTRQDWFNYFAQKKNIRMVPDLPFTGFERWDTPWHWGAGPYAVLVATKHSDKIHLLGFDLYSKDQFINNIYKDTANYNIATKRAVDPSYWIHQIGRLFKHYKDKKFIIHQEEDWILPKEWTHSNVSVDILVNLYYN